MFKVKQLFTKNYLSFAHYGYFTYFNSFVFIRSQSLKVLKSYQDKKVTLIKKFIQ